METRAATSSNKHAWFIIPTTCSSIIPTITTSDFFQSEFNDGFGTPCAFIGPAEEVKKFMLARSPLGLGVAILHIEWITLRHYIEAVRDNHDIDAQFKSLLKHHWMEESQHTRWIH